ncbi:hypothetical protein LC653_23900 [Nostoc sp. CHAB 5784]|uniref:hypothetical protein n=1 Tax=Nostoc mirabile TaxID=2907820 RepID=UPI001E2C7A9A|nr:hypothetical protein [Nostoc mirabile]MCC5666853.1 hypothetical protein [Nostoc mirabile CHAB5784]
MAETATPHQSGPPPHIFPNAPNRRTFLIKCDRLITQGIYPPNWGMSEITEMSNTIWDI